MSIPGGFTEGETVRKTQNNADTTKMPPRLIQKALFSYLFCLKSA